MKILLIHNKYKQEGGEDSVFTNELKMLKKNGIEVIEYTTSNKTIDNLLTKVIYFFESIFSIRTFIYFLYYLKKENISIVHVHNLFPKISPSIFLACKILNVKSVYTLHNYRLICPTSKLYYNGKVCENSLNNGSWWAISKRIYQNSFFGTLSLVLNIEIHKMFGTWKNIVDKYICLTQFSKEKFTQFGIPESKISVKYNFSPNAESSNSLPSKEDDYFLFVGRLSDEKGIDLLLEAWMPYYPKLKIIGDGPLKSFVLHKSQEKNVEYLGAMSNSDTKNIMSNAKYLIMYSKWYEGFPMTIVESFSCGTPAIVPDLGSMSEIVNNGKNGWKFNINSTLSFKHTIEKIINDKDNYDELRKTTTEIYFQKYAENQNCKQLKSIYNSLLR